LKIDGLKGIGGRPLWEGHRNRLRQRLEREGWDALKPYEMVEVVLCHALPRQDLSAVSRLLVDRFGSVGGVFRATREALLSVPGVTPGMAEWINLTGALVSAYRQMHNISDIRLECYRQVKYFLRPLLPEKQRTGLWVIYSDFNFNLITVTDLQEAEVWWEAENARRMVMDAIGHGARYVYMVLWKDDPARGMDDLEIARLDAIAAVLCAAELDLVDCLLVNGEETYSMRVHDQMNSFKATAAGGSLRETYLEE
jgi:DNA repair protein RadC